MARSASPQKIGQKPSMAQRPRLRATKLNATAVTTQAVAAQTAQQQARRKRRLARTWRRFESAFARLPTPALPRGQASTFRLPSLPVLLGLALLIGLASALIYLHSAPTWFVYRETVQIEGATYVNVDDIYAASGVDSWNIFWLRPQLIRERLLALPFIHDAAVAVSLPNRVRITVAEEQPVALWVTSGDIYWLMANGAALPRQDDRFDLLPQLIDPNREAQSRLHPDQLGVDPTTVSGALALWTQIPNLEQLRFNSDYGLNFKLPGTLTWVYWGDGARTEEKLSHLAAVQTLIANGEAKPQVIDVRFERAYFH